MYIVADNPNVIFDTIEGEVVMVNLDTGCYFTMNDAGAALWAQLKNAVSVEILKSAFAQALGASEAEAGAQIDAFLAQLREEGLLREAAEGSAKPLKMDKIKKPEAPKLEVFKDMQDLLLLDPVHEISEQGWPYVKKPAA